LEKIDAYGIVQNSRRRAIITVLNGMGGESCLREVVRRIAQIEAGGDYDRKLVKSIQVSLLQTHLPKMENAGIIEYDEASGSLRLLELPSDIKYHLEVVERRDVPWGTYYLILSLFGFTISLIVADLFSVLLMSAFVIASVVHSIQTRCIPRLFQWHRGAESK
jgi:hypothetical protein